MVHGIRRRHRRRVLDAARAAKPKVDEAKRQVEQRAAAVVRLTVAPRPLERGAMGKSAAAELL
eukprot:3206537-Pleurochrysis_carterae.AAC.2